MILDRKYLEKLRRYNLDSYNDFFSSGINNIFRENNPIRFIVRNDEIL